MTTIIDGIDGLKAKVGEHLGYSEYVEITQEQVNQFAGATGDHQWIHIDVRQGRTVRRSVAHGSSRSRSARALALRSWR
jgi:acyl dehydratase